MERKVTIQDDERRRNVYMHLFDFDKGIKGIGDGDGGDGCNSAIIVNVIVNCKMCHVCHVEFPMTFES